MAWGVVVCNGRLQWLHLWIERTDCNLRLGDRLGLGALLLGDLADLAREMQPRRVDGSFEIVGGRLRDVR